jgi:hypothetical protein
MYTVTSNYSGRKGRVKTFLTDAELVEAALPLLPENNSTAGRLVGVSEGTVRGWRRGERRVLKEAARRGLERLLAGGGNVEPLSRSEVQRLRDVLSGVVETLDRALGSTAPAARDVIDELDAELDNPPPGLAPREAERRRRAG